jgi:ATP-dependent helicase HrpA
MPLHTSLLAGLLSHIGLWDTDKREYVGARGARFVPWPGSALFKKPPRWVMAGELVETSRLWGRDLGRIEPEWVEPLAAHLVKRSYSEPHWSSKQGAVLAYEKVTLYGVPLVASRRVAYGGIDPEVSRDLFIRHALVQGEWRTHHAFFATNRKLIDEVEELEHRLRRRDILVDDETLFDFYDERVPADVVSARHFDSWWKTARRSQPDLLDFERAMLLREDASSVSDDDFPDHWVVGDLALPLSYQFEPGTAADGVTVHIPLPVLNRVSPQGFDWQVPGLRLELVTALLRSLPKALRRRFVPAPDHARALVDSSGRLDGAPAEPLTAAVARGLRARTGVVVPPEAWDVERVPDHLRMTFLVEDEEGAVIAQGKDLEAVNQQLRPQVAQTVSRAAAELERTGLRDWSFGVLPDTFTTTSAGHDLRGYPALVDEGATVGVRVLDSRRAADLATWQGTRRLLLLAVPSPLVPVVKRLDNPTKLALGHNPHGSVPALLDDCVAAALDDIMAAGGGPPRDAEGFARLRDTVRAELQDTVFEVVRAVADLLTSARNVENRVSAGTTPVLLPAMVDIRAQLSGLVFPGFVTITGRARLVDVARYLRGIERRLDALVSRPDRDRSLMNQVHEVVQDNERWRGSLPPARHDDPVVADVRWMIEELRVSLFAQTVGTPAPVSDKRIRRAMAEAG